MFAIRPPERPQQKGPVANAVSSVIKMGVEAFHWGFVPLVIYLGFKKGADPGFPELTWENLLWK